MRTAQDIKDEIGYFSRCLRDSQEHAQIVALEELIEGLQKELKKKQSETKKEGV